jgi:hypothetical protein
MATTGPYALEKLLAYYAMSQVSKRRKRHGTKSK